MPYDQKKNCLDKLHLSCKKLTRNLNQQKKKKSNINYILKPCHCCIKKIKSILIFV